ETLVDIPALVQTQYSRPGLTAEILRALELAGNSLTSLSREQLSFFDEFHIRGREATREIAQTAGFARGMSVLDIGCGIGGPARTLAAEYGCRVNGIDLVTEFIEAARELTRRVGMSDQAQFQQADALDIPFPDSSFEAVMMEHVSMNVADKAR